MLLERSWPISPRDGKLMSTIREEFNEQRYGKPLHLSKTEKFRVESILRLIGNKKKVLDIGCSDGTISEMIARNNNEVYGVDVSESALKIALSRGLEAYKVDLESEEFPFSENYFDVVVAGEIIEHIFDTDEFLNKIKKVLKPDGSLIITTPNLATLGRRLLLLLGKNPLIEVSVDGEAAGHIRYFVKETLVNLLEKHDFKIDEFTSDIVNFNKTGSIYSVRLARIWSAIGRTLIVRAKNIKATKRI